MKTAYVPVDGLPILQELQQNFGTVLDNAMSLMERYGDNDKFLKVVRGGRNASMQGKRSYYGRVKNVGLLIDPMVLDPAEYKLSFGETKEEFDAKQALIAERCANAGWLGEWVRRNVEHLAHVSLFILYPGAVITRHYGVSDGFIRCHLGVQNNSAARFHTEWDEPRTWEPNSLFGFLDYYTPHWVTFEGATEPHPRVVLAADVRMAYYERYYPGLAAAAIQKLSAQRPANGLGPKAEVKS